MTTVKAQVDLKTLEFMMDLPQSFVVTDVVMQGDKAILTLETDDEMPSEVALVYGTDDYGNVALTGFGELNDQS